MPWRRARSRSEQDRRQIDRQNRASHQEEDEGGQPHDTCHEDLLPMMPVQRRPGGELLGILGLDPTLAVRPGPMTVQVGADLGGSDGSHISTFILTYFRLEAGCYNRAMESYRFVIPMEVRYGDLDPQGHLNNSRHLTFFEQARIQYWIHLGLFTKDQSFMDIGVIMAEARVTYRAPIYFGQDVQVGTRTTHLGSKSLTVEQNLFDGETNAELATGSTVLVAYDYHAGKSMPIPDEWRDKIRAFEGIH
jgi:acyl-CoA thioester hydrolase